MIKRALAVALAIVGLVAGPAAAGVVEVARNEAEVARNEAKAEVDASRNEVEAEVARNEIGPVVANDTAAGDVASGNTVAAPVASGNAVVAPVTVAPAVSIECSVVANCREDNDVDNSIRDSFNRDESIRDSFNDEECTGHSCNSGSFNSVREESSVIVLGSAPTVFTLDRLRPVKRSDAVEIVLTGSRRSAPSYSEKTLPVTGINWVPWLAFGLTMVALGVISEGLSHRKGRAGGRAQAPRG